MMRLWLSRKGAASLREQLVTQVRLAILSGELKPGDRLASVREVARKYGVHLNTVSAAYRDLEAQGLVGLRRGSGVFVHAPRPKDSLEQLVAVFLQAARERGFSPSDVAAALAKASRKRRASRVVLAEVEPELGKIIAAEIQRETGLEVELVPAGRVYACKETAVIALLSRAEYVAGILPPDAPNLFLRLRSLVEHLEGQKRPPLNALIGVASASPEVLRRTHTLLLAAGLDEDCLTIRDARESGWSRGLASTHFVIADILTAARLPNRANIRELRLLSAASLQELREFCADVMVAKLS